MFIKLMKWSFLGLILVIYSAQAGYLPPPGGSYFSAGGIQRPLDYFTNLVVSGNIDVTIITGSPRSEMVVTGNPETIKQLQFVQKNDTVYLAFGSEFFNGKRFFEEYHEPAKLHINIYTNYFNDLVLKNYSGHFEATNLNTPYFNANINSSGTVLLSGKIDLTALMVSGNGTTQIHGINSESLLIQMKDNPTVDLTGVANCQSLTATGSGRLRLYWVESDKLSIHQTGKTSVELAGIANQVIIHLEDSAYFNGRYLRARMGYAKTEDKSVADIQFLKTQAVLADDHSTISFFGKPPYTADFMARNGAVLDMNDH